MMNSNITIFRLSSNAVTTYSSDNSSGFITIHVGTICFLTRCSQFAEEKEAKKEESESDDEDMGFGLFD